MSNPDDPNDLHERDDYILSPYCPTCGQATVLRESPEWLLAHFNGVFGRILAALIVARRTGHNLTTPELVRQVYGDSAERLVNPVQTIAVTVAGKKWDLIKLGWALQGGPETEWGGYRLVPVEPYQRDNPFARRHRNPFQPRRYNEPKPVRKKPNRYG